MTPDRLWLAWSFDPGVVIPLLLSGILYARGQRIRVTATPARRLVFWTGWITLTLSLLSPLHELGEALFSAHMLQHEALMLIAAPLLVLSRPMVPMLHGMPMPWRKAVGRWSKLSPVRQSWSALSSALAAWWVHAAVLWIWHFPPFFDATIENDWIHAAQHISFFGSALLFWWALFEGRGRDSRGAGVLYIFTTAVHTSILGALLTLSNKAWYPAYRTSTAAWGLTQLEEQQIGGLIMWVPAGLVYIGAALTVFSEWLRAGDAAHA